jgi:hypothetical protein
VTIPSQRRQTRLPHDNAKFLLQLPDQRFLGPFAGFDLAAGELPETRHRLAGRALGKKHATVGVDQGTGSNKNEFDTHWPGLETK